MTIDHDTRHWLLTWRTYGTWLPGDERGFVGTVVTATGEREHHNVPGTPQASPSAGLREFAESVMRANPVLLTTSHAGEVFAQLRETAAIRGWELLAVAILPNHIHLVVRAPDGAVLLRDFKCCASRRLNRTHGVPPGGSWWSESGSRRVLRGESSIIAAIEYVRTQAGALFIWTTATAEGSPVIDSN